jgi:hypothetical protein
LCAHECLQHCVQRTRGLSRQRAAVRTWRSASRLDARLPPPCAPVLVRPFLRLPPNHVMARHSSTPGYPKAKVEERAARMVANKLSITLLVPTFADSSFCQTKPSGRGVGRSAQSGSQGEEITIACLESRAWFLRDQCATATGPCTPPAHERPTAKVRSLRLG